MILEVCWDGLWTLPFGLSQFHGLGLCVKWPLALRARIIADGAYLRLLAA